MAISLTLNGKPVTLDADPDMPLLWAVREIAGLRPVNDLGAGSDQPALSPPGQTKGGRFDTA